MTHDFHRSRKKYLTRKHWSYNTPKQLWTGRKIEQKISLSIMFDPCVIPKHHKQTTPDSETGENSSLPRQLQRGVEHVLRWCESSSAEQATLHKTCGKDTSLPSKQKKNISQGSIGPYNTPKQLWTGRKIEQKISLSIMFDPCVIPKQQKHKTPEADTGENRSFPRPHQRGVQHVLQCDTSVIPKHHKQKTTDAETEENRSFPRQLQGGVEQVSRWCE